MLYFVGLIAVLFLLSFFNTLQRVIHNPDKYLGSSVITALLGAYLFMLLLD